MNKRLEKVVIVIFLCALIMSLIGLTATVIYQNQIESLQELKVITTCFSLMIFAYLFYLEMKIDRLLRTVEKKDDEPE